MTIKESPAKEAIAKSPSGRVRRTPVGQRNVLTVNGKDPEFEYRVVNDVGDRVEQFKAAGYDVVSTETGSTVGDRRINQTSPDGSVLQTAVGGGVKGVVMRIKKEWYNEDQAAKIGQISETENTMRSEAKKDDTTYGDIKIHR